MASTFSIELDIRWADLDPNFHVLHSKYYDFAASCRLAFMIQKGFTVQMMKDSNTGLVLFREECVFKKELSFGDRISVNFELTKISQDYSRWSVQHEITKSDGTLAAVMYADGAWIDTIRRKLAAVPPIAKEIFEQAPKAAGFVINQ